MNDQSTTSKAQDVATARSARCVSVTLSDCRADEAHAVLDYLSSLFPYEECGRVTPDRHPHTPNVWSASLDVTAVASPSNVPRRPVGVRGPVEVTLQGAPLDVAAVHAALEDAFSFHDEGTVSGDQEREVQLRISSR
ncbi:hypothetical protein QIS99_17035 [Streptomyces sp. B-S-A8]|uniref:Uncharacterized protein n=1 Tax=Streptomyces solicavernae TaxID=3043614 RepID=A0ABT6RTX6_9ACTN|nr:hypothetical protein [Streptomyces sp. B-S-A8]MDI3387891.1 hypothetical protein [Streptomyces sp. B-S-A8]